MNNLAERHHRRPGYRLRWMPALFFALALVLACFLTVQAAVVEADSVEREVDTAVGVQKETGLSDQGTAPASGPVREAPVPGTRPAQEPDSSSQVSPEPSPPPLDAPIAPPAQGEQGSIMGFVLVGLLVVVLGTAVVLMVARAREQGR